MNAKKKTKPPPSNYIAYFTLIQEIGGRLEDSGRGITKMAAFAPVFRDQILTELATVKTFCDQAAKAIDAAEKDWAAR